MTLSSSAGMAVATPAWIDAELAYINGQAHERLEEFAFYVAEDIDWLNEYTREVLSRPLSADSQNRHVGVASGVYEVLKTPGRLRNKTPAKHRPNTAAISSTSIPVSARASASVSARPAATKTAASSSEPLQPVHDGRKNLLNTLRAVKESKAQGESGRQQTEVVAGRSGAGKSTVSSKPRMTFESKAREAERQREQSQTQMSVQTQTQTQAQAQPQIPAQPQQAKPSDAKATQDYLEPINLDSPKTGGTVAAPSSSPRSSMSFASLPARQPFAKKSFGGRTPATFRTAASTIAQPVIVKQEPPTPHVRQQQSLRSPSAVKRERISTVDGAATVPVLAPAAAPAIALQESAKLITQTVAEVTADDDEWVPRLASSGSATASASETQTTGGATASSESTAGASTASTEKVMHTEEATATPGGLRAAMQAASAKATSYLRQARQAFASPTQPIREPTGHQARLPAPAINTMTTVTQQRRPLPSTTPLVSPPRMMFTATAAVKREAPETPSLYPSLAAAPAHTVKAELVSPRRSPSKKVAHAMHSMAAKFNGAAPSNQSSRNEESRPSKAIPKSLMLPKSKPVSIRVATASQREADLGKQTNPTRPAAVVATSKPGSLATTAIVANLNGQSTASSSSSTSASLPSSSTSTAPVAAAVGVATTAQVKRPGNNHIKALAAATQAKEKEIREQERREAAKRDLERRRQENAVRRAEDVAGTSTTGTTKRKLGEVKNVMKKAFIRKPDSQQQHLAQVAPATANKREREKTLPDPEDELTAAGAPEGKRRCTADDTRGVNKALPPIADGLVKVSNETVKFAASEATKQTQTHPGPQPPQAVTDTPMVESEAIELPEIDTDYDSDSSDDLAPGGVAALKKAAATFTAPAWAESPELRKLLKKQARVDPDDVFGPIGPLHMEEVFRGKDGRPLTRFRPRSSSANWTVQGDKLTTDEVTEYARTMGYK
ncbi:hypothetical protein PYCC9005_002060 [Savitreella phatthalungensis]